MSGWLGSGISPIFWSLLWWLLDYFPPPIFFIIGIFWSRGTISLFSPQSPRSENTFLHWKCSILGRVWPELDLDLGNKSFLDILKRNNEVVLVLFWLDCLVQMYKFYLFIYDGFTISKLLWKVLINYGTAPPVLCSV